MDAVMNLRGRVQAALAVAFLAALAACGGGGGGGGAVPGGGGGGAGPTPTPAPTATPPASGGYVTPTGGVTQLGPVSSNTFSSSMLNASADGTFIVQSADTPSEPSASSATLTEYDVTASESAAGIKPGSRGRTTAPTNRVKAPLGSVESLALRLRPRLDPRTMESQRRLGTMSALRSVRGIRVASATRRPLFNVNDQRVFHVFQSPITGATTTCAAPAIKAGSDCYIDVTATLKAVSNHGYVWVDGGIGAAYGLTGSDWQTVATTFDADYARETVAFGPAFFPGPTPSYTQCDSAGNDLDPTHHGAGYQPVPDLSGADPHISILITNALENTGEGGYFFFGSELNDQELNCAYHGPHAPSNALPMFIIGADNYGTSGSPTYDESYWLHTDMPRSLPHEFQHYLHTLNKVFKIDLTGGNGVFDDAFVDEGDAMLAEDLVNPSVTNGQVVDTLENAFEYLFSPGNFSLTSFTGYAPDPLDTSSNPAYNFYHNTSGNYGQAYLFARYLYDRFGGDAALQRVYSTLTPAPGSGANVSPIVAEANGESFQQVYGEFAAALAARNVASTDPRYTFSSTVTLVGSKQVPYPGGQTFDIVAERPALARRSDEHASGRTRPYQAHRGQHRAREADHGRDAVLQRRTIRRVRRLDWMRQRRPAAASTAG